MDSQTVQRFPIDNSVKRPTPTLLSHIITLGTRRACGWSSRVCSCPMTVQLQSHVYKLDFCFKRRRRQAGLTCSQCRETRGHIHKNALKRVNLDLCFIHISKWSTVSKVRLLMPFYSKAIQSKRQTPRKYTDKLRWINKSQAWNVKHIWWRIKEILEFKRKQL